MKIKCPKCGEDIEVGILGRPKLDMPVNKVVDALKKHRSITKAAEELGCSRGSIYNALKDSGHKPEEYFNMSEDIKQNQPATPGQPNSEGPTPEAPAPDRPRKPTNCQTCRGRDFVYRDGKWFCTFCGHASQ